MVVVSERVRQLEELEVALDNLIGLLHRAPASSWSEHFEDARQRTAALRTTAAFTDDELTALAASITWLFEPKDAGFPAWQPDGIDIGEMERAGSRVYDAALELRVIGRY